jgi:hypothetical protein
LCGLHDGRVAASCRDLKIRIYDVFTDRCAMIDVASAPLLDGEGITNLVELPDGRLAGSGGSIVLVCDVHTGACAAWIEHAFPITGLSVVGHRLIVTSDSPCDECECEIVSDCDNCGKLCVLE